MSDKGPDTKRREEEAWPTQTYLEWRRHLYEVVGWEDGLLHVVNCLTDHPLYLDHRDLREATPIPLRHDAPPEDWRVEAAA